jgi:protein-tyrosine phosphatase
LTSFPALVDIHNHLIPGVDDGARDLDDALAALAAMYEQGVRRVVTTPHIDADLVRREAAYRKKCEEIDAAWELLRTAAATRFPDVELARGHEIMLDVPQVCLDDARLRLAGGSAVLVEFPRLFVPAGSTDVLYNIRIEGRVPVVAHPERYVNVDSGDLSLVEEWRHVGARMAVNAGSLLGGFGSDASGTVREMLRLGWVDLIGSDYHARGGRRPLVLRAAFDQLVEWGGEDHATLLLATNPGRLMDGEEPIEVPPLDLREGVWSRLRRILGR